MTLALSARRRVAAAPSLRPARTLWRAAPAHAADEINIDHVETADGTVSWSSSVDGVPERRRSTPTVRPGRRSTGARGRRRPRPSPPATSSARPSSCSTPATAWQGGKFDRRHRRRRRLPRRCARGRRDRPGHLRRQRRSRPSSPPPTTTPSAPRSTAVELCARAPASTTPSPQGVELRRRRGLALAPGPLRRRRHRAAPPPSTSSAGDAADAGVVVDVVSLANAGERRRPGRPRRRTPAARSSPPTRTRSSQVLHRPGRRPGPAAARHLRRARRTSPARPTSPSRVDGRRHDVHRLGLRHRSASRRVRRPTSSSRARRWSSTPGDAAGRRGALPRPRRAARHRRSSARRTDRSVGRRGGSTPTSSEWQGHERSAASAADGIADLKGSAVALTDKVVNADLETRISQRLAGAGSALTAAEWLLLHAGIAVGAAVVGFLLGGAVLGVLGLVLGVVAAVALPQVAPLAPAQPPSTASSPRRSA